MGEAAGPKIFILIMNTPKQARTSPLSLDKEGGKVRSKNQPSNSWLREGNQFINMRFALY